MKRGQWVLLTLFALAIFGIAAYVVGSSTTEQRRVAARAALDTRVEEAKAQVEARQQRLRVNANTPQASPLTEEDVKDLTDALEAAWKDGWTPIDQEISDTPGPWPPDLIERVSAWLDARQDLLAHARALAQGGTDFDIPIATATAAPEAAGESAMDFLDFGELRSAVRLLNMAALLEAEQGNNDAAIRLFLDALSVGDEMGAQPAIITQMLRFATYRSTLDDAAHLTERHALDSEQLDQLDRVLADAYQRDQFAAAMANEAQIGITTFSQTRNASVIGTLLRPIINMNEASYTEGVTALAEVAGQPYYESSVRIDDVQRRNQDLPFTHYISRTLLSVTQPALLRAIESQASHEAAIDMARIAIALERAYQQTGAYPDVLDAVTPYLGGQLPVDPFTGQPYRYRAEGDTFTLYSVGSDLIDDNGTPGRRGGDQVWNPPPLPAERP